MEKAALSSLFYCQLNKTNKTNPAITKANQGIEGLRFDADLQPLSLLQHPMF